MSTVQLTSHSWVARMRRGAAPKQSEATRESVAVSPDLGFIPAIYVPRHAAKSGRAASRRG